MSVSHSTPALKSQAVPEAAASRVDEFINDQGYPTNAQSVTSLEKETAMEKPQSSVDDRNCNKSMHYYTRLCPAGTSSNP